MLDIVAARGGAEFDTFLARYRAPANPQEENRYLYALASFDQPAWPTGPSTWPDEVRTQNAPFVLQPLLVNRMTGPTSGDGSPRSGTGWWPPSRRTSSPGCSTGPAPCAVPRRWPPR